uniref:Outer membrane protein porin n=1 Tax=Tanacetum cinerariifolium TaxID=118510 RepID=A0A6L2J274_TANCI|nr:hypothetical protein [Tanacetum cinerariifolium]
MMSDRLAEEKNNVHIKQTEISELKECLRKKDFENEHLKSKVVNFTMVQNIQVQVKELQSENKHLKSKVVDRKMYQNLQVQVEELKSVDESFNLLIEEMYKVRAIAEATLRERHAVIFARCEKIRLLEEQSESFYEEMGDKVKRFDDEKKVFENKISKLEKDLAKRVKDFDDKNNDLRTSYNVLKEEYEISCVKLEKENNHLKIHYKRLFDSIKQKNVASQVFTKSIPKVNVSDKIYTGESSKPISKKVSHITTYSLQKDRKYLKKQYSSETFVFQNHVKNESSKQTWKSKENISKRFKYSRDEMFSMRKRDESILKKVKDVRFPFILERIFHNETPSCNNKWKSSSSSRINTSNETPHFRTMFLPLKTVKTPNETSRFYKSKWTNEKSFKSPLI